MEEKEMKKLGEILKESITLLPEERGLIRAGLISHIKSNPVREAGKLRRNLQRSPFISWFNLLKPMPIFLVLVLLLGGGVSYAAEGTVPGDTLYPVKVEINEHVRSVFTVGATNEAAWQTRLVERRLEEAETLAVRGEFNAKERADIESRFETHIQNIQFHINELRGENDLDGLVDVAGGLETALKAHEAALGLARAGTDEENKLNVDTVLERIRVHENEAARVRADAETKVTAAGAADVETAAKGKLGAAENKIAEVRKFIDNVKSRAGAEATAQAEAKLALAEKAVADGKVKLEAGASSDAFMLFREALGIAQEAKLLISARANIEAEMKARGESAGTDKNLELNENEHSSAGVDVDLHESESIGTEIETHAETQLETEINSGTGGVNLNLVR